jgi:hypothetical protein
VTEEPYNYRGWRVWDRGPRHHPVTGRWMAFRYGVRIGHSDKRGILSMIDNKIRDEQDRIGSS